MAFNIGFYAYAIIGHTRADQLLPQLGGMIFKPPANFVCGGYTVFTLSVRVSVCASIRASVRPSITFCFLNILKSHCWIFIKHCKHVHIYKTNT